MHLFTGITGYGNFGLSAVTAFLSSMKLLRVLNTANRKPFVPQKPYFTISHKHMKLVLITRLVLVLPQCRSLLAISQITLKNPSTYARLSTLWNSNLLVSCQTSHGHHNFSPKYVIFRKIFKNNAGLKIIKYSVWNKKDKEHEKYLNSAKRMEP